MSQLKEALAKLCANPPPADLKWNEHKGVLEHLGYELLKSDGSRRKFFHKGKNALISCHQPHPSPDVDKGCIKDVVEHLKSFGFI